MLPDFTFPAKWVVQKRSRHEMRKQTIPSQLFEKVGWTLALVGYLAPRTFSNAHRANKCSKNRLHNNNHKIENVSSQLGFASTQCARPESVYFACLLGIFRTHHGVPREQASIFSRMSHYSKGWQDGLEDMHTHSRLNSPAWIWILTQL